MMNSAQRDKKFKAVHRSKITEHSIYRKLYQVANNARYKKILLQIWRYEIRYYRFCKDRAKRVKALNWIMVYVVYFFSGIFGYQIGVVGFTKEEGRDKGLELVSVAIDTPRLRERFNGKPAHYKLIADTKIKTITGAQIISEEILSSTIDKLAITVVCNMPL
jgi:hypothetical protein